MTVERKMKQKVQFLGTSLVMLLIVAAAAQALAQEPYKLSAELSRGTIPTKHVSMGSMMAVPKRDALGESPVASDLHATVLDRPALSEDSHGVKETRESNLAQIAAAGGAFARGLKSASSVHGRAERGNRAALDRPRSHDGTGLRLPIRASDQ